MLLVADGFDPYLTVLDVSDPSQPFQISTQMVPDQVEGVDATESYFYVATYGAGLHIYENPYGITTSQHSQNALPDNYILNQNYPNPFNPSTTIQYSIPEGGNVSLKIFNTLGEEVAELVNEYQQANTYMVNFNGENLSSGIYFYQIRAGEYTETKKMVIIK